MNKLIDINIEIVEFDESYTQQVIDLILDIQNNEYQIGIDLQAQKDLTKIIEFYVKPGGNFLLAISQNQVIGTIGLLKFAQSQYAIRKMFVKKEFRGSEYKIAQRLLDALLNRDHSKVYLGTIDKYQAAIRFYEKNNFIKIDKNDLPVDFPRMEVDNVFFYKSI